VPRSARIATALLLALGVVLGALDRVTVGLLGDGDGGSGGGGDGGGGGGG
jgi:hypothetical protein